MSPRWKHIRKELIFDMSSWCITSWKGFGEQMEVKAWGLERTYQKTLVVPFHSSPQLRSCLPFKAHPNKLSKKASSQVSTHQCFSYFQTPLQRKGGIMGYITWTLWALSGHFLDQCSQIYISAQLRTAQGSHPLSGSAPWRFLFPQVLGMQWRAVAKHKAIGAGVLWDPEQVLSFLWVLCFLCI